MSERAVTAASDGLRTVCDELLSLLARQRPAGTVAVSAAAESGRSVQGRFADGRIVELSRSTHRGASLRCIHRLAGEGADTTTFHHVAATEPSADLVRLLLTRLGGTTSSSTVLEYPRTGSGPVIEPLRAQDGVSIPELAAFLEQVDAGARSADPAVSQVLIGFEVVDRLFCVGADVDERSLVYLTVRAIARRGSQLATGVYTPGTSGRLAEFTPFALGAEAGRRAVTGLGARPAPVGHFPVVVRGGRGIVLLHEACCHPLESDEVLRGSVYADQIGRPIAAPHVTITDDPTAAGSVGQYRFDDEGQPARPTLLVENGVLRALLTSGYTADRLSLPPTPNARCSSVLDPPLPRMSTTCLAAGQDRPEDILSGTEFGIYAENVGGGEVTESTGEFVFRVNNGYLIRNGRITDPIRDTTIAGRGDVVLKMIDAVGNDTALGAAKCRKQGQGVPVGLSGPTLRVASLLVGGTDV